ncbi:MAG: peptide ABC transporter substrate-binding protein [Sphaerochaetaceae bacterium]
MKKFMTIMLCVLLVGTLFVSCGKKASTTETEVAATPATTAPAAATPAPATKAAEPVAKTAEPAAKPAATTATEAPAATASPKTEGTNVAAQPAKNANEIVFRIANGAEPESLDPALIQGVPEHRIYEGLFEGLVANDPKDASPVPGVAESWSSNEDGTVWTFKIRKDAKWSDGVPITAHDVVYSWLRELDPATASPYAWFPCMFVKGANEYNSGKAGKDAVAIKALDDYTFQMELLGPLPYAIGALTHYSFAIVPEHAIEKYGTAWTDPKNFVGNGPYVLTEHVAQDHVTLSKNPMYWDAKNVKLDKVIFIASDSDATNYKMYKNGELDWDTNVPLDSLAEASMRDDYHNSVQLATYYYTFQTQKAPVNDAKVRRALSLAVDRQALVDGVTKAGQIPAWGIVPEMAGYEALPFPNGDDHQADIEEAQKLLADAGYPNGVGFPTISILYNTNEAHKKIAEFIQQEWKNNLGINVTLENQEWQTYLSNRNEGNFIVARAGWVGDYQDPNTFLDMFITGAGMNGGKYSNDTYDLLINEAARMPAGADRFGALRTAEDIMINQDQALMPLYYYVTLNLVDTNKWGGWYPNTMDYHPVKDIYLK